MSRPAPPALGVLEMRSIARGYLALDAMSKRAEVVVAVAEPVSQGKFWIAIVGNEAEVGESMLAGVEVAADARIDHVYLPGAHDVLHAVIKGGVRAAVPRDAIGVLEMETIAATVRAADAALKCADVSLVDLHLARGIGGKGVLVLTGSLSDVDASLDAGAAAAGESAMVGRELMANPDAAVAIASASRGSLPRG